MSDNAEAKYYLLAETSAKYVVDARLRTASKRVQPISPRECAAAEARRACGIVTPSPMQRDEASVQTLLISTIPNLRAFAKSLCRNPAHADDLVQDTLVKAWTNLESFEKGNELQGLAIYHPPQYVFFRPSQAKSRGRGCRRSAGRAIVRPAAPAGPHGVFRLQESFCLTRR